MCSLGTLFLPSVTRVLRYFVLTSVYPGYPVLGTWYWYLLLCTRVCIQGTWNLVFCSRVLYIRGTQVLDTLYSPVCIQCIQYLVLVIGTLYSPVCIQGTWNLVLCTHQSRLPSTLYLELGTWYSPVCIQGHNESCRPRFLHGLHLAKEIVVKIVTFEHCNDGNDGCRSIFVICHIVILVTTGSAICQDWWLTGI